MSDMRDKVALLPERAAGSVGRRLGRSQRRGASVVLPRGAKTSWLASEIKDQGGTASFVTRDVSAALDVQRMLTRVRPTFGPFSRIRK